MLMLPLPLQLVIRAYGAAVCGASRPVIGLFVLDVSIGRELIVTSGKCQS